LSLPGEGYSRAHSLDRISKDRAAHIDSVETESSYFIAGKEDS
jgi:hypothetical protein